MPAGELVELIVRAGFGAADDWIAEHAGMGDIVITSDIPLAARCLANGARVLDPKGHPFNESDIGSALAMRDLIESVPVRVVTSGEIRRFGAPSRLLANVNTLAEYADLEALQDHQL